MGNMSISLGNVVITPPGGTGTVLTPANVLSTGNLEVQPAPTITATSTAVVININSLGSTVTKSPFPVVNPGQKLHPQPGVFQTVRELPSDQQETSLSNNPRFQSMPPERQQQIRNLLQKWNSWTSDQKNQQREVEEIQQSVSPANREGTRTVFPSYRRLPPARREAVLEAFRHVRDLPADQRERFLSTPRTQRQFSSGELQVLEGLTKHLATSTSP